MIDPVIFEFNLFGLPIILRWYGVLVMLGAVSGALIAEREVKRRGENGESVWDALVWVRAAGAAPGETGETDQTGGTGDGSASC